LSQVISRDPIAQINVATLPGQPDTGSSPIHLSEQSIRN